MATDAYEQIEEAVNLIHVTMEKTEEADVIEDLEAILELLQEAQHSLEIADEMNEMMSEHGENMEDLTEL